MQIKDRWVWLVAILSVVITYIIGNLPSQFLGGYIFNYELLIVNGAFTFLGLVLLRRK